MDEIFFDATLTNHGTGDVFDFTPVTVDSPEPPPLTESPGVVVLPDPEPAQLDVFSDATDDNQVPVATVDFFDTYNQLFVTIDFDARTVHTVLNGDFVDWGVF